MKTIFILITRGLITRNILRNDCFKILKERKNLRIIILFLNIYNSEPPKYLKEELVGDNVIVEFVPNIIKQRTARLFRGFIEFFVYTKSTRIFTKNKIEVERGTGKVMMTLFHIFYSITSKVTILKKIARFIEWHFFQEKRFDIYFDKYKPDLVFSTAILSNLDIDLLKQAKKRKIKTISLPKSWDNLDKVLFRAVPDLFLVQNEWMKEETVRLQDIKREAIKVVGFPQFDVYKNANILTREEYCRRKNFDPSLPIIFIGSEGKWSAGDEVVFQDIIDARESGLIPQCNLLIRPHFSFAPPEKYQEFNGIHNIFIDNNFRHSIFFGDKWDPTEADQEDFTNSLYHCSLMATFASTIALDVVCFDKPILLMHYGVRFGESKETATQMYNSGHYEQVMNTNAILLAHSKEEVVAGINKYLVEPSFKSKERQLLREKMCGILDGHSGERIANYVLEELF